MPVAGPMDAFSHRLANQLVGNDVDAATLEITLIGPELIVEADTTMAIAGAQFEVTCDDRPVAIGASFAVQAGSASSLGASCRARAPISRWPAACRPQPVLGSRATHLVSRMGGFDGRALRPAIACRLLGEPRAAAAAEVGGPDAADQGPRAAARDARPAGRLVSGRCAEDDRRRELPHLAAVESHGLSPAGTAAGRACARAS